MHDYPNEKHTYPPASEAARVATREWLIRQLAFSGSDAAYPGVARALDRAAQALIEARLLASGFTFTDAQTDTHPESGNREKINAR
jgi:hypothetical protein